MRAARPAPDDPQAMPRTDSRWDHLENSVTALVDFWGDTGWRRDPLTSFSFGKQERALSDLRYAVAELRRAVRPSRAGRRKLWLVLVAVPAAAATFAVLARTRRSDDSPEPSVS
jgi:hypothetical protein